MSKYPDGEFKKPGVTTVLGATMGGPPLAWPPLEMEKYIKAACVCKYNHNNDIDHYQVSEEDLKRAKTAYKRISQTALAVGSLVHKTIEYFLKTGKYVPLETPEATNCMKAFYSWYNAQDEIETIATEMTVLGDHWGGTLDWHLIWNGEEWVIDFKTSKPPTNTPKNRIQTAAYRSEVPSATRNGVLRLDKATGEPDFKDFSKSYEKDLDAWNKLLIAYLATHPRVAKDAGWEG
jgi:hypothetical protein